jgi:hypothetical protein
MIKQWTEPSWSSRTNPAHQAQPGSGQDLDPTHLPLSLFLFSFSLRHELPWTPHGAALPLHFPGCSRASPALVRWALDLLDVISNPLRLDLILLASPLALDLGTLAAAEPIRPPPVCSAALRRPLCASPTGQQRVLDVARRRWCRGATCAATVAGRRCCYYYCELTSLSL